MYLPKALLPFIFIFANLATVCHAELIDRAIAVVNSEVITLSEVNEAGKEIFQRVAEQTPPEQLTTALGQARQSVIESLIEQKILLQEARKNGIEVTDEDVDNALKRILERNNTSLEQFRRELATIGMNEKQYRENLKKQILGSKVVGYEVRSKVIIPEERIIDYYDTHYTEQVDEGGYYILQIGISYDQNDEKALKNAEQKGERILSLAKSGQDFKELARQYSDLPSAADGGDIGVFQASEMASYMRDAVTGLAPGEISDIIKTPVGLQIYKLLSSQEGQIITKVPYEEVKEEIRQQLFQQEMENRYQDWMKQMREGAYVKIL